ncbi:phosphoribosyltransferase [Bacteroidales bacterium OttesenSCG-928-M06]|nr:phosphoribosyltransferase [Bacteroidales bacterium OttesenSCG-928-M06]
MAGDERAKRIHFNSEYHRNALRRTGKKGIGKINLPFKDTINPILKSETDCILFDSQFDDKCYRTIKSEEEYEKLENFVAKYREIVFLRDNLELSLALSANYASDNVNRTEIGELEYQAKHNDDEDSKDELIEVCNNWLNQLPYLNQADYICAMPSSNNNSLPQRIVEGISGFDFENISEHVFWTSKTRSVKDAATIDEKLAILDESGLTISGDLDLGGKTVLLFDDLYMSGISMQYVAMKLKEAGAQRVFGLSIVKSRSNTAR